MKKIDTVITLVGCLIIALFLYIFTEPAETSHTLAKTSPKLQVKLKEKKAEKYNRAIQKAFKHRIKAVRKEQKNYIEQQNKILTFEVTAYTAGYISTGKTPDDPAYGITASGKKVQARHTIASDWSVLPLGTKVKIEGFGETVFVVEDKGSAIQGKRIDIYMKDRQDALKFGRQMKEVEIIELGGN